MPTREGSPYDLNWANEWHGDPAARPRMTAKAERAAAQAIRTQLRTTNLITSLADVRNSDSLDLSMHGKWAVISKKDDTEALKRAVKRAGFKYRRMFTEKGTAIVLFDE
jgi:hypothetical protein